MRDGNTLKRCVAILLSFTILFAAVPAYAGEVPAGENSPVIVESPLPETGGDIGGITYSVIDSDGNSTVNGEYVLIINHSKTNIEKTGNISALYPYQSGMEVMADTEALPDIYPIDYHPPEYGGSLERGDNDGYEASEHEVLASYTVGYSHTFSVMKNVIYDGTLVDFNAEVLAVGSHCIIWGHDGSADDFKRSTNTVTTNTAQAMAAEFDSKYPAMVSNFGDYLDVDDSGKVSLLVYDIQDGFSGVGGYVAGYFWSGDMYSSVNGTPMVHIDTYPTMGFTPGSYDPGYAYSTMVHEFQHMINFSTGVIEDRYDEDLGYSQDTFINEMLSMAAEEMFYHSEKEGRLYDIYNYGSYANNIANGWSLTQWNSDNSLPNYALSYMLGQYLVAQTGGYGIFSDIVSSEYADERAIISALASTGSPLSGMSFEDLHMNFRAALALHEASGISSFAGSSILESDTINKNLYKKTSPSTVSLSPGASILLKNVPACTYTFNVSGKGADVVYYGLFSNNNHAPVAQNGSISADSGTPVSGTVTATDFDHDTLTYSTVTDPAHGALTLDAGGSYTYTSDTGYIGFDSFTFNANDGELDSNTAAVSITVNPIPVTSIALSTDNLSLSTPAASGGITPKNPVSEILVATVNAEATLQGVTWKSSNTKAATVNAEGVVTAVGKGTATITATTAGVGSDGKRLSAACAVTVRQTAASVAVPNITVAKGGTAGATATVSPSNADYKGGAWESLDTDVAAIDPDTGLITGILGGTAAIRYTTEEGAAGTGTVTVRSAVTGVSIGGLPEGTIRKGDAFALTAVIEPADANNKAATWTSSRPSVASVDNTGHVDALTAGTAVITVKTGDGSKTAYCTVNVLSEVTGISLNSLSQTLAKGGTFTLAPTLYPAGTVNCHITWSVTDADGDPSEGVVSVDAKGKVTAVGATDEKTAIVWAETDNGKRAGCVFTVTVPVTGVTVSGAGIANNKVTIGTAAEPLQLTAAVLPENADSAGVAWTSSKTSVATVDDTGLVTPVGKGSAAITATVGGKKAAVTVIVAEMSTGISLNAERIEMARGKSVTLIATVTPATASNKGVVWRLEGGPATGVTLKNGKVTAAKTAEITGETKIVAQAADGSGAWADCVLVLTDGVIGSLSFNAPAAALYLNGTPDQQAAAYELLADGESYDASKVIWTSSNVKVAAVDAAGNVTAVGRGKAMITAAATDGSGKKASATVTVRKLVEDIILSTDILTVALGKSVTLKATVSPADADVKTLRWGSDNGSITVSGGKVTVNKAAIPGDTATITAYATDASVVTADIDVAIAALPKNVTIGGDSAVDVGGTLKLTAAVLDAAGGTDDIGQDVTWTSSSAKIATVDAGGTVTGVGKGKVTVTAAAKDGSGVKGAKSVTVNIPATGVTLNKPVLCLLPGKYESLKAAVLPAGASNTAVTWRAEGDPDIAVDAKGKVTVAKSAGNGDTAAVTVTTADGSYTATCEVTVVGVRVSGIKLDAKSHDFTGLEDTARQVNAIVSPAAATNPAVVWTSSDDGVASVDEDGLVRPVGCGSARITATAVDGLKSAYCTVNVYPVAKSDKLSAVAAKQSIEVGATAPEGKTACQLRVRNQYGTGIDEGLFTYTSSKPAVAAVDESGNVTAGNVVGSATITAALTGDPARRKVAFTVSVVTPQVKSIEVSYTLPGPDGTCATHTNGDIELLYAAGQKIELIPVSKTANGANMSAKLTWTTGNKSIATVSVLKNGHAQVTVLKPGSVEITAQAGDTFKGAQTIRLTAYNFTPQAPGSAAIGRSGTPDAFGYASAPFAITAVHDTEIADVSVDTVMLGRLYKPAGSFRIEESMGQYVVKAAPSVGRGTYTLTIAATVQDGGPGGKIGQLTGETETHGTFIMTVKVN